MSKPISEPRIQLLQQSVERVLASAGNGIRITPFRSGVDCFVDLIEIDGERSVIRSARHEVLMTSYEGEVDFGRIVEKDAQVIDLLTQASVPTPRLLRWHRSTGSTDVSWMITSFVDHATEDDVSPEAHRSLGKIARRIHSIEPQESHITDLRFDPDWDATICKRIMMRVDAARRYMETPPKAEVEDAVRRSVAGRSAWAKSLLHLDLRGPNLATSGSQVTCVFDFSNAIVGDPLLELARVEACGLLSPDFLFGYGRTMCPTGPEALAFLAYGLDIHALLVVVAVEEFVDLELQSHSIAECTRILRQLLSADA